MPYTTQTLPDYVKKRAPETQKKWLAIFNEVYKSESEEVAFIAANSWLKKQVKKKETVARTSDVYERVEFVIDNTEQIISRTEDGQEYVSFKLADVFMDKFGVAIPENILGKWADAINTGLAVVGDVDHKAFEELISRGLSTDQVKAEIKNKPGIAKAIKAVVEKGRLWVRAIIDKRYKSVIQKSKGVSLEAVIKRDANGNVSDGDLLGFTFAVKQDPVIPGTEVYT